MQRGIGDGHAAHKDGRQLSYWGEFASTTDLDVNVQHRGQFFLRRKLVRNGPTRFTCDKAQLILERQCVDFVNHAIDVIGQSISFLSNFLMKPYQAFSTFHNAGLAGHWKSPGLKCLQQFEMRNISRTFNRPSQHFTHSVGKETQWTLRSNVGVELTYSACSGITRIDEGFFTLGALLYFETLTFIQRVKIIATHIDFSTNFHHGRDARRQLQRDLTNGSDVVRHILAILTIASRCGLNQNALFVSQAHGQTIKFEFCHIFNGSIGLS